MMAVFEPLTVDEAISFHEEGIWEFLAERSPTGHVTQVEFDAARGDLGRHLLPDGVRTSGHRFEATS